MTPTTEGQRRDFDAWYDAFEFRKEYDKYGPSEAAFSVWQAATAAASRRSPPPAAEGVVYQVTEWGGIIPKWIDSSESTYLGAARMPGVQRRILYRKAPAPPPAAEWVELSDEDINRLAERHLSIVFEPSEVQALVRAAITKAGKKEEENG